MPDHTLTSTRLARYVGGVYERSENSIVTLGGEITSVSVRDKWPCSKIDLEIWPSVAPRIGGRMRFTVTIALPLYTKSLAIDGCLIFRPRLFMRQRTILYPARMYDAELLEKWLQMPAPEGVED